MGFPPALWFGGGGGERVPDATLAAALEDDTAREIVGGPEARAAGQAPPAQDSAPDRLAFGRQPGLGLFRTRKGQSNDGSAGTALGTHGDDNGLVLG